MRQGWPDVSCDGGRASHPVIAASSSTVSESSRQEATIVAIRARVPTGEFIDGLGEANPPFRRGCPRMCQVGHVASRVSRRLRNTGRPEKEGRAIPVTHEHLRLEPSRIQWLASPTTVVPGEAIQPSFVDGDVGAHDLTGRCPPSQCVSSSGESATVARTEPAPPRASSRPPEIREPRREPRGSAKRLPGSIRPGFLNRPRLARQDCAQAVESRYARRTARTIERVTWLCSAP